MNTVQHILCASDLSDNAGAALRTAVNLAALYNARLTLIHVFRNDPALGLQAADAQAKVKGRLETLLTQALAGRAIDASILVREGDAVGGVLETVSKSKVDLVVAGTHGHTGFRTGVIGNVAENIVLKGISDTLLVRPDHAETFKSIALAVDFSSLCREAFNRAIELVNLSGLKKLALVHVYKLPDEYWLTGLSAEESMRRLKGFAELHMKEFLDTVDAKGVTFDVVIQEGGPQSTLAGVVRARNTDLLVMGSHGRTGAGSALLGSIAAKTMRECPASMWIETEPQFRIGLLRALSRLMGIEED
jgi:nucleotide-binding universal stress UspA family protein